MQVIGSQVIIKKIPDKEVSEGGIVMVRSQEGSHGEITYATVISVGPKNQDGLKEGDKVMTQHGMGANFVGPDGEEYHILREGELIAIIEE